MDDRSYRTYIERNGMSVEILHGNCLARLRDLEDQSINTCITSPPYWGLRNYEEEGQIGLENTPEEFVENLVQVFREVKRVLRDDGTVWLNLGDSFLPNKQLGCIPFKVAMALQKDSWILRQDIIWHKPNCTPESVKDRCTKAHEYIFLLSKSPKYYYDNEAVKEDCVGKDERKWADTYENVGNITQDNTNAGIKRTKRYSKDGNFKRNRRSVWTVTTKAFKGSHFATFPMDLIEPCVLAGCPEGGTVLDPFGGAGTTALVANKHNRNAILIELNQDYIDLTRERLNKE